MNQLTLESIRLKNFKAIRDSGVVSFTPLTVFIGNNGSGKSSLIEGLQTYQQILFNGLYNAMNRWRGFENIHNPPIQLSGNGHNLQKEINPTEFAFTGTPALLGDPYRLSMTVGMNPNRDEILSETLDIGDINILQRDKSGETKAPYSVQWNPLPLGWSMLTPPQLPRYNQLHPTEYSTLSRIVENIAYWQFLTLNPYAMGDPKPQNRSSDVRRLEPDGSNIGQYLFDIRKLDKGVFDGIVETLQYVLPYAEDLQPILTSELERDVSLQLTEGQSKIPGWLLSTGTLRILAILAVLRHPEPAPLIVIEEIENGLDPRTIHLIVEEMRNAVENGRSQIILTTHSPYLLNLLTLSQIVIVERNQDSEPVFSRPADRPELERWTQSFSPGDLYTAGRLNTIEPA